MAAKYAVEQNERYTDSYGRDKVRVTQEWVTALAAVSAGNGFLLHMHSLARRLGYLSVAQYERANRAVH